MMQSQNSGFQSQSQSSGARHLDNYQCDGFFDEMFLQDGTPRPVSEPLYSRVASLETSELLRRQRAADHELLNMGITFNVYGHDAGAEKIMPFDLIPRIIARSEWQSVEAGLRQRIKALNMFINDMYHGQEIIKDGIVPGYMLESSKGFLPELKGMKPPRGIWCHITGTDLVRGGDGQIYVLEDNLRCPSGVSYVIENREVMKRTFPQLFGGVSIAPVETYPEKLLEMLQFVAPDDVQEPTVVVLSPGIYNSAYFEHCFLAQQMGVELVQGSDLVVHNGLVHMKTTQGLQRVDVIYRRIDDAFLDPDVLRPDSALGVRGLMQVYRNGRVSLVNAPGTGVADDKAVYAYVPEMIKYYLNEEMSLPNVQTFLGGDPEQLKYILAHVHELVIKPANESGGYGILLGPRATAEQIEHYKVLIAENPRNYVAQPMLELSRVPTLCDEVLEGRHVDLRPYILYGEDVFVLPGGLTRVALVKNSLVVNSSQGGGSKDTWVLEDY